MNFTAIQRDDFLRLLEELALARMPFGRYGIKEHPPSGFPLIDLPLEYLCWFKQRGFPKGRLGELMAEVCAIKEAGMDELFNPIRQANGGRQKFNSSRRKSHDFGDDS